MTDFAGNRAYAGAARRRLRGILTTRSLVVVVGLFLASVVILMYALVVRMRDSVLADYRQLTEVHAHAFEQHLTQTVDSINLMLQTLIDNGQLAATPRDMPASLRDAVRRNPQLRSLSVVDETARVVASTNRDNLGVRVELDDLFPRGDAGDALRVSLPRTGRDLADSRVLPPDGSLGQLGHVLFARAVAADERKWTLVATLNPDYFANHYAQMLAGSDTTADVVRFDGVPLVSSQPGTLAARTRADAWVRPLLSLRDFGHLDVQDGLGPLHLNAYRSSAVFPLTVVVSTDSSTVMSGWRAETTNLLVLAALPMLLALGLAGSRVLRERRALLEQHAREEDERVRLTALMNALPLQLAVVDDAGQIRMTNEHWQRFTRDFADLPDDAHDGSLRDIGNRVRIADPQAVPEMTERVRAVIDRRVDHAVYDYEARGLNGTSAFHLSARGFRTPTLSGALLVQEDRTERQRSQRQLELAATVFDASAEGIVITDKNANILSVNPAFTAITGYAPGAIIGRNPRVLSSGLHDQSFYREMWWQLTTKGVWEGEISNRRRDGTVYPEWLTITAVRDAAGACTNYIAVFSDITERKASENRIRYLSEHDFLTGLMNRAAFERIVADAVVRARQRNSQFALLFIDLDRFKTVNDTLGHAAGDRLLQLVGERIAANVRRIDTISRQGGDEFLVLIDPIEHSGDPARTASALVKQLGTRIDLDKGAARVSASIGIAVYPKDGADAAELIQHADTAMYHAKRHGPGMFSFFEPTMNETAMARLQLEHALREAVENRAFELHYQPLVDLATRRVVGVEALLRWTHPTLGPIGPQEFIPVAEECGLIRDIGDWVLQTACAQQSRWRRQGLPSLLVAVNVSALQFADPYFVDRLAALLVAYDVPGALLELEVTETVMLKLPDHWDQTIERLKQLGVRLAIDDFGTGYSSLAYLRKLPIEKLKIDRSFVQDVCADESDAKITRTIVAMAHSIGVHVLAEGIETVGQYEFLRAIGCNEGQGFLFSRAVPPDEIPPLLAEPIDLEEED